MKHPRNESNASNAAQNIAQSIAQNIRRTTHSTATAEQHEPILDDGWEATLTWYKSIRDVFSVVNDVCSALLAAEQKRLQVLRGVNLSKSISFLSEMQTKHFSVILAAN